MSKASLIKFTDLFSFIGLCALISTGALLKFSLPPGSSGANIWGLTRHQWGDIHFYVSVGFLFLMSLHLFLHIKFIKQAIRGRAAREHNYRLVIGILSLLILVLLLFAPLLAPIEGEGMRGGRHNASNQSLLNGFTFIARDSFSDDRQFVAR